MDVTWLNNLPTDLAGEEFTRCCGSPAWVEGMIAARPFKDADALLAAADAIWWDLPPEQWLEAFAHHPQIGNIETLRAKFGNTKQWASSEQAGVAAASEDVLQRLAKGNAEYLQKFGYIFIVCATGKTAAEMLGLLESRLPNSPESEIKIAAEEQRKITRIRLEKLCKEALSQPTS